MPKSKDGRMQDLMQELVKEVGQSNVELSDIRELLSEILTVLQEIAERDGGFEEIVDDFTGDEY